MENHHIPIFNWDLISIWTTLTRKTSIVFCKDSSYRRRTLHSCTHQSSTLHCTKCWPKESLSGGSCQLRWYCHRSNSSLTTHKYVGIKRIHLPLHQAFVHTLFLLFFSLAPEMVEHGYRKKIGCTLQEMPLEWKHQLYRDVLAQVEESFPQQSREESSRLEGETTVWFHVSQLSEAEEVLRGRGHCARDTNEKPGRRMCFVLQLLRFFWSSIPVINIQFWFEQIKLLN